MQSSIPRGYKKSLSKILALRSLWITLKQTFRKPITVMYPYERLVLPQNSRGGFALDMDLCTGCGLCDWVCPDECIDMVEIGERKTRINNVGRYPEVHIEKCCFCGLCAEICPRICILMTSKHELAAYTRRDMYYDALRLHQEFKAHNEFRRRLMEAPEDVKHGFPRVNKIVKERVRP